MRRSPPPWRRCLRERALRLRLHAIQRLDRLRLRRLAARHPGLWIDPDASSNLAVAHYSLAPGSTLRIAAGVVTEHQPGRLHFLLAPGARVEIGEGTWLRTEVGDVHLVAFDDAELAVGPESLLNGCHLSAKTRVVLGRRVFVGPGSRVFDADQHDLDDARADQPQHGGQIDFTAARRRRRFSWFRLGRDVARERQRFIRRSDMSRLLDNRRRRILIQRVQLPRIIAQ